ncbi:conserved hypothetical protein [Sulfurimonas denitrificans DSM 1251]|jgi:hypothetical protein|uniref:Uncharacterized protein n=1 Tax=Sulfurimonas denitrificans (strain ATCC 33889 / DSM 1251) TaxID=326298 RepID=Q30QE6_SULDN|nr:DUF5718 family protein [Sulfurimonas denitrificans]ABB44785.1 conserved hypothetical protein [Sulfurimonas denitrificans DSM 1251]MDD3443711.1 DUF5718 family protein [Sulfurimonas denitrificans]
MQKYRDFLGLGIAGNFALHLAQAGELEDFKNIITTDEAAPKGMFPFYLPSFVNNAKYILSTYPLSSTTIKLPSQHVNIQAEPEVALICDLEYENNRVSKITPTHFGAYNDCSIRVAGAAKISDKKNWGADSKGISENLINIDSFTNGSIMDNYSICSFLKRDDELHAYGENVELLGYSYFYEKLLDWMLKQINTQEDFGPLEPLSQYILECQNPNKAIISIGATRYTPYGESTFLKESDELFVILYNHTILSLEKIIESIKNNTLEALQISLLRQKVVR